MTNGDAYGQGNLRQDEAVAAQVNNLGITENDLIFFTSDEGNIVLKTK